VVVPSISPNIQFYLHTLEKFQLSQQWISLISSISTFLVKNRSWRTLMIVPIGFELVFFKQSSFLSCDPLHETYCSRIVGVYICDGKLWVSWTGSFLKGPGIASPEEYVYCYSHIHLASEFELDLLVSKIDRPRVLNFFVAAVILRHLIGFVRDKCRGTWIGWWKKQIFSFGMS